MSGIAALPDDLLLEVFSRVGSIKDLFRFSLTCRWWLRRFTDPDFLRPLCLGQGQGEERRRARLLGFFFQKTRFELLPDAIRTKLKIRMRQRHTSVSAPRFLPAPGSPLGPTSRALTSFVADDDRTFNYAEPLAARRGFVLMQLVLPRRLGLCNPITGERHILPPLPKCSDDDCGRSYDSYAIVTATDSKQPTSSSGRFKFSQLLLITTQIKNNKSMHLHSYTADTRSWSAPTMCLNGTRFCMVGERSAVIHQGVAHWLCIDRPHYPTEDNYLLYKLSAEVGTGTTRASLTKMPMMRGGVGSPLLGVNGDGKLSVACMYPLHVTAWTQQGGEGSGDDDDTSAAMWLQTATFRLPIPICQPSGRSAWLSFKSGSVLMLPLRGGGVFVFDLEKKVVEKVMDWQDCLLPVFINERNGTCVAYELNLVDFFVLQLGGLRRGWSTE
ncbi:unnamed protein product [Urochloa humidicola]